MARIGKVKVYVTSDGKLREKSTFMNRIMACKGMENKKNLTENQIIQKKTNES